MPVRESQGTSNLRATELRPRVESLTTVQTACCQTGVRSPHANSESQSWDSLEMNRHDPRLDGIWGQTFGSWSKIVVRIMSDHCRNPSGLALVWTFSPRPRCAGGYQISWPEDQPWEKAVATPSLDQLLCQRCGWVVTGAPTSPSWKR